MQPTGLLQKAAAEIQKQAQDKSMTPMVGNKSPKFNQSESVYQETAPSTNHNRDFSRKDLNEDELKYARCPPKRMRSYDKETNF